MKKSISRKLSLNKTTVANLNAALMSNVKGGSETYNGRPACYDFEDDGTTGLFTLTCDTCNTNCGQNTCQVTCDDLITG